jgi:uncharacterized repeat protein (TIGR01451 family)/uncharacterized protein (TIGR03382 family)
MTAFSRTLTAVLAALGAFVSSPALAQTSADLGVTLTTQGISYGGTGTFKFEITNTGPDKAVAPTVTATLPEGVTLDSVSSNCTPVTAEQTDAFPCQLVDSEGQPLDLDADASVTVKINVTGLALPDPIPETCPSDSFGDVTATVTSETADPGPGVNTASALAYMRGLAVLETTLGGPTASGPSAMLQYTVDVKNKGPCPAPDAWVDFYSWEDGTGNMPPSLVTTWSTSVDPAAIALDMVADGNYSFVLGDIEPGASVSLTVDAQLGGMSKDLASTVLVQEAYAYLEGSGDTSTTDDPGGLNDVTLNTKVTQDASGCGTGGAEGFLSLALLGLMALRRRFRR